MSRVTPYPANEDYLCKFCAFLANQGLSLQTIKCYLSAVRHQQIAMGFLDPHISGMARLEQVLRGIKRVKAKQVQSDKPRLPITLPILSKLKEVWLASTFDDFDGCMLWAVASVCFFGIFRAGELTSPTESQYDSNTHLTFSDIAVDDKLSPSTLQIHLKASKTDPFRLGVDVFIGKAGNGLCPVRAMTEYLSRRGGSTGPLFHFKNGKFLTRCAFVARVRDAMSQQGIDPSIYSGHSFRRGAATAALDRGLGDATIKMLGRWKSDAYTRYIKTPRAQLAAYTQILAKDHKA